MDNRGRLYCISKYLNYQSSELSKSLLLFNNPGVIKLNTNGYYYLRIYGANCFGNGEENKSFEQRAIWVKKKLDNILNFENGVLIKQVKINYYFYLFV